jgi:hypothetical protein
MPNADQPQGPLRLCRCIRKRVEHDAHVIFRIGHFRAADYSHMCAAGFCRRTPAIGPGAKEFAILGRPLRTHDQNHIGTRRRFGWS